MPETLLLKGLHELRRNSSIICFGKRCKKLCLACKLLKILVLFAFWRLLLAW